MDFQLIHKYTLPWPLIAAWLALACILQAMRAKRQMVFPKHPRFKFFLASARLTGSHFGWP